MRPRTVPGRGDTRPRVSSPPTGRLRLRILLVVLTAALVALAVAMKPLIVRYHLAAAREALMQRDQEQALASLKAAERLDPDHGRLHFLLARTYRRAGRFDLVRTHLERARRAGHPAEPLRREESLVLAQTGRVRDAEPHLAEMLQEPQDDGADICEAYVNGLLVTYRLREAFDLLDAWQADFPEDSQPHFTRGVFSEHVGNDADAAEHYRKALQLAPGRTDVRLRLALCLVNLHKHEEAEEHLRQLLARDPQDPDLMNAWGECLHQQGRVREARENFAQLVREHPDHFEGRLSLAKADLAERPHEARVLLESLYREKPLNYEVRFQLASALQATGASDEADEHFAFVSAAQDAMGRATNLIEYVESHPRDVDARYELGTILLKYDSPTAGANWLRSVLEHDPDHAAAHEALAGYYAGLGEQGPAEHHRRSAAASRKRGEDGQ